MEQENKGKEYTIFNCRMIWIQPLSARKRQTLPDAQRDERLREGQMRRGCVRRGGALEPKKTTGKKA